MIPGDFLKAVAQLGDPRFRRVLWLGIALSVALLIAAYALLLALIQWINADELALPWVGQVTWLGDLLSWGSLDFMLILSAFLMIPVASAITSLFLDDVAEAVEDAHYPGLPPALRVPFGEAALDTFSFLGILIAANILALVAYALFPYLAPVIFYVMNGFLLGREYFQIAAIRRVGRGAALELQRKYRGQIWLAGCLMCLPLSMPLLNLLVPVLGAATFTHLYHRLAGQRSIR